MRKSQKRRLHNRQVMKVIRTQIKKVLSVSELGKADELVKEVNLANKKLDKAASKRVVHPNFAARKKSQMAKLLRKVSTAKA
jgi:small subunit ribosomal protein S20